MNAHAEKGQALSGHRGCVCPWVGEEGEGAEGRRFASARKERQSLREPACYNTVAPCWRHSCSPQVDSCTVARLYTVRYPMCTWRARAEAEGLTLRVADNKAGYFGVTHKKHVRTKPYEAQVNRGGKTVSLGTFATAEEAALCIARSPEGQAAAKRAAAAPLLTSEEAEVVEVLEAQEVDGEAENVQVVEVVAVMEPEAVVDEGGRSKGRLKRRRNA